MVRSASTRSTKYGAKVDGDVINARITAEATMMKEQISVMYPIQQMYEMKLKRYLERIGTYGVDIHHYMNYMYGLWRRSRTFTSVTLRMEAEAWASFWLRRGLAAAHLIHIAGFFGIDLTAWSP